MKSSSITRDTIQQDTLLNQTGIDTTVRHSTTRDIQAVVHDTPTIQQGQVILKDSARAHFYQDHPIIKEIPDTIYSAQAIYNPYRRTFNTDNNFLTNNSLTQIGQHLSGIYDRDSMTGRFTASSVSTSGKMPLNDRANHAANWIMLIFITVILLFIWIKIFYNKFFSILSNSIASYQLSAKVFHEKNVLLKRVSLVLDVIYLIVLSVFLYECFAFRKLTPMQMTSFNLFLLLFNIVILFTLTRSLVLKLFSYLFQTEAIVSEYVHNNFIINKSIGIVLFPLVFAAFYMQEGVVRILLWAGVLILGAGIIFKIIRGYQIIIRKDILFIYLILYLCTLEILPLLLGYKVFMSLL
jgi:hypothetical protein